MNRTERKERKRDCMYCGKTYRIEKREITNPNSKIEPYCCSTKCTALESALSETGF